MLFDGEKVMHTPEARKALKAFRIRPLPGWPAESPDLNPQENVWSWVDREMKRQHFTSLQKYVDGLHRTTKAYPSGQSLVPSLAKRVQECIAAKGGSTFH